MSARDHYQNHYGYRARSHWGTGDLLAPWAEGDIVNIPADSKAFTDGRIPHAWSKHPELSQPGLYRIVTCFSIGEGDEWYFRVCPIVDNKPSGTNTRTVSM